MPLKRLENKLDEAVNVLNKFNDTTTGKLMDVISDQTDVILNINEIKNELNILRNKNELTEKHIKAERTFIIIAMTTLYTVTSLLMLYFLT